MKTSPVIRSSLEKAEPLWLPQISCKTPAIPDADPAVSSYVTRIMFTAMGKSWWPFLLVLQTKGIAVHVLAFSTAYFFGLHEVSADITVLPIHLQHFKDTVKREILFPSTNPVLKLLS